MFILQIGGFIIKQENKRHFTDILSSGLEILAAINAPSQYINLWNSAKPMANRQEIGMVHRQWLIYSGKVTTTCTTTNLANYSSETSQDKLSKA